MAIVSFVLSLVWLGGLGSLLGVVFGLSARQTIKQSAGLQGGRGFATAGVIIGVIGLLGSVVLSMTVTYH